MKVKHFPDLITSLPPFAGPFDAHQLNASNCAVLFASYPAGTEIEPHTPATDNRSVITAGELILVVDEQESRYGPGDWYHLLPNKVHAARFEVETSEIEFWFDAGTPADQ
ncbi:MAG: cupin domain-containing protein [Gammaproteobacteria bacterium]|nr:cupin domain-containing protein [Gammaproteobacteria bacterium]